MSGFHFSQFFFIVTCHHTGHFWHLTLHIMFLYCLLWRCEHFAILTCMTLAGFDNSLFFSVACYNIEQISSSDTSELGYCLLLTLPILTLHCFTLTCSDILYGPVMNDIGLSWHFIVLIWSVVISLTLPSFDLGLFWHWSVMTLHSFDSSLIGNDLL